MNGFGYRMMNFLRGRYGWDQLGMVLMVASFALELLGRILRLTLVYYLGVALFLWMFFRMFSRNIPARVRENQWFMDLRNRRANKKYFRQQRKETKKQKKNGTYTYSYQEQARENQRGTVYCYYYCPACKQQVRVPAGRGKIRVTCPRCQEKFETYS